MSFPTSNYRRAAITGAMLAGLLSACGGGGDSGPAVTAAPATLTCAQLANMQIAATSIGMPTTGAVITATQTVAANGTGANAVGEYCLASGQIMPVDPTAPNIKFQVALLSFSFVSREQGSASEDSLAVRM